MKVAFVLIVVVFALLQQSVYCRPDVTKTLTNPLRCISTLINSLKQHYEDFKEYISELRGRYDTLRQLREYCDNILSDPPKYFEELQFKMCETSYNATMLFEIARLTVEIEQLKIEQPELLTGYWEEFTSCIEPWTDIIGK